MTTLLMIAERVRLVEKEKAIWAVGSILMSGAALNILPIISGGIALYAAGKAENALLKLVAMIATLAGMCLGMMAAW